jgi:hypothetical protein
MRRSFAVFQLRKSIQKTRGKERMKRTYGDGVLENLSRTMSVLTINLSNHRMHFLKIVSVVHFKSVDLM